GFFVNTLVLDGRPDPGAPFAAFLSGVRDLCLDAYAHQELPFDLLVEQLAPERTAGRVPLVATFFQVEEPLAARAVSGLTLAPRRLAAGSAKIELLWAVTPADAASPATTWCEYETALFEAATIERLLGSWETLLAAIVSGDPAPLSDLPLLSPAERHQLAAEWSGDAVAYPRDATVHELFAAQAAAWPEAVALATDDRQWTYGEVERQANRLARRLGRHGVAADSPVGLLLARSPELVVAMLAVLKAGGCYVPLDPGHPAARTELLVADTGLTVAVSTGALAERLPAGVAVVRLDADAVAIAEESAAPLLPRAGAESAAYVMFTSGSTGRPKGVVVTHRGIVRMVRSGDTHSRYAADQVWLHLAPPAFDAATFEVWGALLAGARLVVYPAVPIRPEEVGDAIVRHRVDSAFLTAALFHQVADEHPSLFAPLLQLVSGGDVLEPQAVTRALAALPPGARFVNGYGPTENTTFTSCHRLDPGDMLEGAVPIGRPVANTTVHLLDRALQPVPIGAAGELCTGGDGLARGYLGRPELTAERFVPSPSGRGERLYRTGDLARFRTSGGGLPDGTLEFLGRVDRQLKIRGFRVEPGEVEAALAAHPAVAAAAVAVRDDLPGGRGLVACFVSTTAAADELRAFLAARLPEPLVPAFFVPLAALPQNANGKVDRAALGRLALPTAADRAVAAPRSALEERLVAAFREVLGVTAVGVEDSFFHLGGHSLLATRLVSRLRAALGVALPLSDLFEAPTPAGLARRIEAARRPDDALPPLVTVDRSALTGPLPLSFAQRRLWFLDQLAPGSPVYHVACGLRLTGRLSPAALAAALREVVRRHEALRTTFVAVGDEPAQRPLPPPAVWPLPFVDLAALPPGRREAEALRLA
ncbi:MAG TPA: amino acid adenylation domain-containing protein, partial [Thermoanaerobaculia bacterium]